MSDLDLIEMRKSYAEAAEAEIRKEEGIYSSQITPVQTNDADFFKSIIYEHLVKEEDFKSMKLPDRPYYMEPWLRAGTLALLYAERGIGKTWLCLCIAIAITHKLSIGPWKTIKPVSCTYIDGEMSADDLQDRLKKLTASLPDPSAPLWILSSDLLHANNYPSPNLCDPYWREAIYEFFSEKKQYKILILDNLSSLTPGIIENEKQPWDEINQWLLSLRFLGVAVILVHHSGKSGEQRGTSGREDNLDISICLTRPKDYLAEDGAVFDVEFKKARGIKGSRIAKFTIQIQDVEGKLTWTTEKQKYGKKNLIIALLGQGVPQNKISEILNCNKGYVSRIKNEAISGGIINKDANGSCKFTISGKEEYGLIDIERYLR